MVKNSIKGLYGLYCEQLNLFEELHSLSIHQHKLLNQTVSEDICTKQLGKALVKKKSVMSQIDMCSKEITHTKVQLKKQLGIEKITSEYLQDNFGNEMDLKLIEAVDRIEAIKSEIASLNNGNITEIQGHMSEIKQKIKKLKLNKQTTKAYSPYKKQEYGYFIDKNE